MKSGPLIIGTDLKKKKAFPVKCGRYIPRHIYEFSLVRDSLLSYR